jgi:hypothetical protein
MTRGRFMTSIDKPDIVVKASLEYRVQVTTMQDEDVLHGSGLKGFHTEFTTIYCLRHSDSSLHKGKIGLNPSKSGALAC